MSILIYAFTHASGLAAPEPLRILDERELAAVVGGHDQARLERTAPSLWSYEQMIERLSASRTILPAQFGTVLGDDEQVRTLMRERYEELAAGLERVRGAVELGTRARWRPDAVPPPPDTSAGKGTAYLEGRVAVHRRARDLARRLDPLGALARDVRRRIEADQDFPVREAYLIDREHVSSFADAVRSIDEGDPEIEMVCTGPWPPYSFAGGSA